MSILIFNRSPHKLCPYEKYLSQLNQDLILLTSEAVAHEFEPFDYAHIESFENYETNGWVDWRAFQLYEQYQYHTVIAIAEVDLIRAAQLRERFDLAGQTVSSAIHFRDKAIMKAIAQKSGIPTPPFSRVDQPFDLIDFVRRHGFPVIIKPVDGVGSRNTLILQNRNDLIHFLKKGLQRPYQVESFINGEIYHVDGVIINGELQFICASKYTNLPIQYHQLGYLGSYLLHPKHPLYERLIQQTKKILKALPTPLTTTFHAEWFHTPDDQMIFCEIASRTGGGKIIDTVFHAYDINLFQAFVEPQCQLFSPSINNRNSSDPLKMTGWVKIAPKQGTFLHSPKQPPPHGVIEYELMGQEGKHYHRLNGIGEAIAAFVVEGESENDVYQKLISTAEWFHQSSKWVTF